MDYYILHPAISSFVSLLLFCGCYQLGKIIVNNLKLNNLVSSISIIEFQYFTFGIVFLLIILFPLVAFTKNAFIILKLTGFFLILLGSYFLFKLKEILMIISKIKKIRDVQFYIYIAIIFLYFLLALAPLTSADILDYHAGTALDILRLNSYKLFPEWFTGLQAGAGEVLIALGFAVGSEQFGSLVQFSSILIISGIILNFSKRNKLFSSSYFLILTILTCPILIFLLSGNKPQIFYSSLILVSLSLNFIKYENKKDIYKSYTIINILICCAVLGKFSFNLIGFLVWAYSSINFIYKVKNFKILLIPILIFIFIYAPFVYWKYLNLGGNIFTYFYSPFPLHLPGYENFLNHNKGSQEIPFPKFLFYTTASRATEFLALNTILLFILLFNFKKNKNIKIILILSFSFILISNLYASPSARYYLDVILWSALGITFLKNLKIKKIIEYIFYPQILIVIIILIYSASIFFPGALTKNNYIRVKQNHAYMFSGMSWVNKNIPENSSVLIINRPISLYKDFSVSGGFNYFTNSYESKFYKTLIKKYNINYVVYLGNTPDLMHLKNCVGEIYKQKKNVGFHATRNPFNKGGSYNAYIFDFDNDKLPDC